MVNAIPDLIAQRAGALDGGCVSEGLVRKRCRSAVGPFNPGIQRSYGITLRGSLTWRIATHRLRSVPAGWHEHKPIGIQRCAVRADTQRTSAEVADMKT